MIRRARRENEKIMVLEWLSGSKDADALIARGKYKQAIDALSELLQKHGADPRLRMKLADVLVLSGRQREAVPVLLDLADEFAAEGQAAKSIALLKKVQRIDPGRAGVEGKLADVLQAKERRQRGWDPQGQQAAGQEPPSWAASTFSPEHFAAPGAYSPEQRIAAARSASWVPSTRQEEPVAGEVVPVEEPITVEEVEMEILDVIQDALQHPTSPTPASSARPASAPAPGVRAFIESPLFSGFSRDELVAVIQGLNLLIFEPGDIVLTEGDAGNSLYVITEGTVKTFVRDTAQGGQVLMRRLKEGDFFGEISILSGKARSATVTAATHCEMLELDRPTLDQITASYPNVRRVLEDFYLARAMNTAESPDPAART
jgi:cyclic nucleotide-binding protein/tetratricopeptide repeat protein